MSKYDGLWDYIQKSKDDSLLLTFEKISEIAGVPLDHSFLSFKKELQAYGWQVGKISLKKQTVCFARVAL